jgi:hypothetical protein
MKKSLHMIGVACLLIGPQAALASCPEGSAGLPNSMWSWVAGPSSTDTTFGGIAFAGNSGNGFADVTVTTTTVCYAVNPGGQTVDSKSTTVVSSVTTEDVKVCEQSPHATDLAGDLCTK